MATYHPSRKLSKLNEPELEKWGRAHKCCTPVDPIHMDEQRQDDQLELTYSSCVDTGCSPEDLPEALDNREGWRERFMDICADSATWWWRWWKHVSLYASHIFLQISHIGCICQPSKIWWQISVQPEALSDFSSFWIVSKQMFSWECCE